MTAHDAIAIQLANARVTALTQDVQRDRARIDARAARSRRRAATRTARRRAAFAPLARLLLG
jgi:hypothetical protein